MNIFKNDALTKTNIEMQKTYFKGARDSLCQKCAKIDDDCNDTFKQCEKSKNSNFSRVVTCSSFKDSGKAQN